MKKFNDISFNDELYHKLAKENEQIRDAINTALSLLDAEGIATDSKTIEQICKTDKSFGNYLLDLADARVGKDFMPADEKARIFNTYTAVYRRLNDYVQRMRESIPKAIIIAEKDTIKVDADAMEKKAKADATYTIDTKRMQEYYNLVMQVKKSFDDVREYELKNGLDDFKRGVFYQQRQFMFGSKKLIDFLENPDTKLFEEIFRGKFKK